MSAAPYDPREEPTPKSVALRLAAITAAALLPINALVFVGAAVVSGVTSAKGASMTGVYCDARSMMVHGVRSGDTYTLTLSTPTRDQPAPHRSGAAPENAGAPLLGTTPQSATEVVLLRSPRVEAVGGTPPNFADPPTTGVTQPPSSADSMTV